MPQPNSEPISGKEIYVVFLQVSENIHSQERIDVIFAIHMICFNPNLHSPRGSRKGIVPEEKKFLAVRKQAVSLPRDTFSD